MIAVTGANGLLGSFIVRELLKTNARFVAIRRKDSDTSLLSDVSEKIIWREADIVDVVALNEALKDVSVVIHAAGMVSFNPRDEKKIYAVNVEGTRHIVDACAANNVRRLLHVSSVAALGRQKDQREVDESNKWIDSELNTTYAQSKYKAELEVFRGQEEGLSTVIVNPTVILAPADWNRSSAQLFKYIWQEKKFYIDGSLNYVDVRDAARIIIKLLDTPIQNERFILAGGSIPFLDFFKKIAVHFNKKTPTIKLNKSTLKFVAKLEMLRSTLTNSTPLITSETARLAGTYFSYNNQKIRTILGEEFQTIDETLRWCCEYYIAKINEKK